ncbi:DUF397 domain-containing protein [Streptomyces luteireticuli]|uniref:DUF397 domain-containing protein n=1 Tax=Streptomyces luteireticuli TaxID=173858 RepID=UPI00355909AD
MRSEAVTKPISWQKSSYSGGGPDNSCIELAQFGGGVALRESSEPKMLITIGRDLVSSLKLYLHKESCPRRFPLPSAE